MTEDRARWVEPRPDPRGRAAFWDARILAWETARYSPLAALNPFAWTVRRRLRAAQGMLGRCLAACPRVIDLGCGSGRLAEAVRPTPGRHYLGIDLSGVAVEAARQRFADHADRIRFEQGDALAHPGWQAPLIVFLGLLDWLDDDEVEALFSRLEADRLLFSFTTAGGGPVGSIYGWYRRRTDRTQRARTFHQARVVDFLTAGGYRFDAVAQSTPLDPGRLVTASRR